MQLHIAHRAATASPVPPQQQQPVGVPPPASLAGGSPQSATPSSVTTRRVGYKDLFGIVARICPARKADLEAFGLKLARAEREGTHTPDMLFRHAQQHTQELCGQEVAAKAISYLQQVVQLGKHRSSSSSPAPQQQQQAQHAQQQAAAQQPAQQQPQAHNQAGGLFNQHLRAPSPVSQTMQQQQVQMATRPQPVPQQQMQFQQQQQQQKRPAGKPQDSAPRMPLALLEEQTYPADCPLPMASVWLADSPADERDAKKAKAAGGTAAAKKKEDKCGLHAPLPQLSLSLLSCWDPAAATQGPLLRHPAIAHPVLTSSGPSPQPPHQPSHTIRTTVHVLTHSWPIPTTVQQEGRCRPGAQCRRLCRYRGGDRCPDDW